MVECARPSTGDVAKGAAATPEIPTADRGLVVVNSERCKGCGLCVNYCPPDVLAMSKGLNTHGYHPASYAGEGCTGCAICFYVCPEPDAITVYRREGKK